MSFIALRLKDLGLNHLQPAVGTVAGEDEDGGIGVASQSFPLHQDVIEAVAVEVAAGEKPDLERPRATPALGSRR